MSEALQIGLGVGIPAAIIIWTLSYLSIPRHQQEKEQINIIRTDERGNRNSADIRNVINPFSGGKRRKTKKSRKNKK
jgi:hypothetical protein